MIGRTSSEVILCSADGTESLGRSPVDKGRECSDADAARAAAQGREGQMQFSKDQKEQVPQELLNGGPGGLREVIADILGKDDLTDDEWAYVEDNEGDWLEQQGEDPSADERDPLRAALLSLTPLGEEEQWPEESFENGPAGLRGVIARILGIRPRQNG